MSVPFIPSERKGSVFSRAFDLVPVVALVVSIALVSCKSGRDAPRGPVGEARALGAERAWTTHEAERARTNGSVRGPLREYLTPESEASGGMFVHLEKPGQYIEWTIEKPANSIVVRHSIPDAGSGGGKDATLSLFVDGKFVKKLAMTSRYSWIYGDFPWSNDPSKGKAHHFFDECHAMIGDVRPGQVVRLQKGDGDDSTYAVDFIEFEQVPAPLTRPDGSLSLVDFGAVADGRQDASPALLKALDAARSQGKTLWIPEGEFRFDGGRIPLGGVSIQGAGMWYSKWTGKSPMFAGTGGRVSVSDLAIFGEIDRRVDDSPDNAFDGNFGSGSVFRNLWIEHFKCGFWTSAGTRGMKVTGCRIRNHMADGLNFCEGTSDSSVEQCHVRNTGDDSLATWSTTKGVNPKPCVGNRFVHNTVELPWLANCIALYGGSDHVVSGNLLSGTVFSGGGILISSGFESIPYSGSIRIENNEIRDAGGDCYIGENIGSLWIHGKDSDMHADISVSGLHIVNSAAAGISIHGPKAVHGVRFCNVSVSGARGHGVDVKPGSSGSMSIENARMERLGGTPVHNGGSTSFSIRDVDGSMAAENAR